MSKRLPALKLTPCEANLAAGALEAGIQRIDIWLASNASDQRALEVADLRKNNDDLRLRLMQFVTLFVASAQ